MIEKMEIYNNISSFMKHYPNIEIEIKEELPKIKIGIATLRDDIIGFATKELVKYIKGEK